MDELDKLRITPACAGNTEAINETKEVLEDHPRMRGEHGTGIVVPLPILGSPPHARGTPAEAMKCKGKDRITPACAGNTRRLGLGRHQGQDHPRMRGEHIISFFHPSTSSGSPPHARGTLERSALRARVERITPACAGNTVVIL